MADRMIQGLAAVTLAGALAAAGWLQPKMVAISDRDELRYTSISVDGAPPIVALGTAIGALRGLIVDYLWIKVTIQKENGLLYEVMSDADLITKLQPRFPEVWSFHGHNMAYNISVMTNTPEERWAWVNAGISLVRERGIRYNPNDLVLHKELAFWFSHKIDGLADDAHLFYKRQFAREWHYVLGPAPFSHEDRIAAMKRIADAPGTLDELYAAVPATRELVADLEARLKPLGPRFAFALDRRFLVLEGEWAAQRASPYAQLLGMRALNEDAATLLGVFDATFGDAKRKEAADALLATMRKRVLIDAYNMDPTLMYEYTRDTGPLDWRHAASHALYWARRGNQFGGYRITDDKDIFKSINNDRVEIQAMQALSRSGLVAYDPFSGDNVTRLSDARWIKVIDRYFQTLYDRHYDVRGGGADSFTDFHENFMKQAVRELYRAGDPDGAQEVLDRLDRLYGSGGAVPNMAYKKELRDFVNEITFAEYEMQPEVARGDVFASLRRGFREGLLLDQREVLEEALVFARDLTRYFREARYNDFVNKFGEGRMKDLIGELEDSVAAVLADVVMDTSQPLYDRLIIFRKAPEDLRALVWDRVEPAMRGEYDASRLASMGKFDDVMPKPVGLEEARRLLAEKAKAREAEREKENRSEAQIK